MTTIAARQHERPGENTMEAKAKNPIKPQAAEGPLTSPGNGNRHHLAFFTEALSDAALEQEFEEESYRFFLEYRLAKTNANLKDFIESLERTVISRTLNELGGNQKAAARFLGIKYTTLNERIRKQRIRIVKMTENSLLSRFQEDLRIQEENRRIT